jgi:hypothetical protein
MMLNDTQRQLVAALTDPGCPNPAAVRAEIGTGVGSAIEQVIKAFARSTSVLLVVANHNVLVEQWLWRLEQHEEIRGLHQLSVPLALDMLDRGIPGPGSVVVAKVMDLRLPLAQKLLSRWSPGVLVIEGVSSFGRVSLEEQSGRLLRLAMASADRVIVVTRDAQLLDAIPVVGELSRLAGPGVEIQREGFAMPAEERAFMHIAGLFTQQNQIKDWPDMPDTRPTLMDRLLKIATSGYGDAIETSWSYIDVLERLGTDQRLVALDQVIEASDHGLILVVAPSLAELDYVVQHLESSFVGEVVRASTRAADIQWSEVTSADSDRKIIVTTPSALGRVTHGIGSITLIIWSRELRVRDQLADLLLGGDDTIQVVVLEPVSQ